VNNKGQFSIIAALLVAVVLVATVIVTYSTIRNNLIQDQPRVLSAIDETNYAIGQILGFTVGYYGSILKVTGNSSYAKELAMNYLHSGLINIANIHPEWGASFDVSSSELDTYWFMNTSYSGGNLVVEYNLTGIGIYGITHETSCHLTVQIGATLSDNQTRLEVTIDEDEPLINLGKQNFEFYRYEYTNSTWELIAPTTEPIAYANGTYVISIPPGVDPYSYLVQVEDQRGLIVVASSFSHYTCTLTWNSTSAWTQNYVDNNTSNVDSSQDKGTHSDFPAQQAGPDSIYDRLTEENTGRSNSTLIDAESFEGGWPPTGWSESPPDSRWNKESNRAYDGIYSADFDGLDPGRSGGLATPDLDCSDANAIYVSFYFREEVSVDSEFRLRFWNGATWVLIEDLGQGYSSGWHHWETKVTNSQYFKSDFRIRWYADDVETGEHIYVDLVTVKKEVQSQDNYQLDLEVQWTNTYYNGTNEELCICVGAMGSEDLRVDAWNGSAWENLFADLSSGWNNISVSLYLNSSTFTIRFNGGDENSDAAQDSWEIDATLLHIWPTEDLYSSLQDATIVAELLQNGTFRWLGQNMQLTTQAKPIPPIPVRSIHINQTINNVNREVPFQVEDWASDYRIPLGLTNNASVFSSRTMLVFLVNPNVSKTTIWWDGRDIANQTSYAYVNRYFTGDDVTNRILTNGILTLDIITSGSDFKIKSTVGTCENTARFMRINSEWSIYGADPAYAIHNGIVRDIIHQEAEWSSGANNCPNLYANIVLTLPANATYYTYKLRLMFVESQQSRSISDLCLIQTRATVLKDKWGSEWSNIITENGTESGTPLTSYSEAFFYNFSDIFENGWAHHWSELIENNHGFGVMTTTEQNHQLYALDEIAGTETGGIDIDDSHGGSSQTVTIEVKPASLATVSFKYALDVTWCGAVVTFNGNNAIYPDTGGITGLWIIAEYPPTIAVTTES
jgi:hypothetical protein